MSNDVKIVITSKNDAGKGLNEADAEIRGKTKGWKGWFTSNGEESGKGFGRAFGKFLHGDISGSLETLGGKMGEKFSSLAGKALLWGGGIATAFIAGWKAGKVVDEFFGISDKISAAWNKGADEAIAVWDRLARTLQGKRLANEAIEAAQAKQDIAVSAIQVKQKVKGMSPQERADYYAGEVAAGTLDLPKAQRKVNDAENLPSATKGEGDKKKKRLDEALAEQSAKVIQLEEFKVLEQDAIKDVAKDQAEADKKAQEEMWGVVDAYREVAKAKVEAEKKAQAEINKGDVEVKQGQIDAANEAKDAAKNAADEKLKAIDAEIKKLDDLIAKNKDAQKNLDTAILNPQGWRAGERAKDQDKKDKARENKMLGIWGAADRAGSPLSKRAMAALDAADDVANLPKDKKKKDDLDKISEELKKKALEAQIKMAVDIANLQKDLKALLQMGGN